MLTSREVLLRATEAEAAELGVCVVLLEAIRKTTFFVNRNTPKNMPLLSCMQLHRVYVEASLLYAGTDPDKRRPISIICYDNPRQATPIAGSKKQ